MPAFLFSLVSWRKERIERKKEKSYTRRLLEKLFVKEAYMSAVAVEWCTYNLSTNQNNDGDGKHSICY